MRALAIHRWRDLVLLCGIVYFVLLGGTQLALAEPLHNLNAVLGAALVAVWLWNGCRWSDMTDRLLVAALLLVLGACLLSRVPRASLDDATTLLGYAALFTVLRRELVRPSAQRTAVLALALCGGVLVSLFVVAWIPAWQNWMAVAGPGLPPLDLKVPAFIFGFKYQVAILIGCLIPAILAARRLGSPFALVGGLAVLGVGLIVMSGARSAWLAIPFAAAALLLRSTGSRPFLSHHWRGIMGGTGAVAILIAAAWMAGALEPIVQRATASSTIDLRFAIWSHGLQAFAANPLAGSGPGTFPMTITLSGYFGLYPQVGHGPDSAPVQIISESGLLGVAAVALAMAGFIAGLRRNGGTLAGFALAGMLMYLVSSLTNDTVDGASQTAVLVIWAALAVPASRSWTQLPGEAVPPPAPLRTPLRIATGIAGAVVAGALGAIMIGSFAYAGAAAATVRGDGAGALGSLDLATALDPANALYRRERGLTLLAEGRIQAAYGDLMRALALNPADTLAARGAAVAALRGGRPDDAVTIARYAADLRPTDTVNLVALAWVADQAGDTGAERDTLARLLTWAPWMPAAPSWAAIFPEGDQLQTLLLAADAAGFRSEIPPSRVDAQATWLAAVTGDPQDRANPGLAAITATLGCDPAAALDAAERVLALHDPDMWDTVAAVMALRASDRPTQAQRLVDLARQRNPDLASQAAGQLDPAPVLQGATEDLRLYRERGIDRAWPGLVLPDEAEALSSWMADPLGVAPTAAPGAPIASCTWSVP